MSKSRLNDENIQRLQKSLGYDFNSRPELLIRALTHRSHGSDNYERLEFLGDSLLGFIIADIICERFPAADEGQLTRLRASLVRQGTLAELGRELDLGRYLILGPGALKSGDQARDSILSDVIEAIIGAIYYDGGIQPCRLFINRMFADRLALCEPDNILKDPKTRLQEHLQQRSQALPEYTVLDVSGPPHKQSFKVQCLIAEGRRVFHGQGASRRKAEQDSAEKALQAMSGYSGR
ncbi:MAG: ribonuclease III [Pseudomonadota bacterium]|nr:ribonuclease III [Pseudomonadota bacterium]